MTALEAIAVLLAGFAAGTINVIVGSGTLITFPVLLAVGYPPVTANVSNTLGLVPAAITGTTQYLPQLRGQRARVLRFASMSVSGAILGAIALLTLPDDLFEFIVPVLIVIALVMVVVQPKLKPWLERRQRDSDQPHGGRWLQPVIFLTGIYGGYFGAAQGILLMGAMGIAMPTEDLQRLNAIKNVLAGSVNAVAAVIFLFVADIAFAPAALIAVGAALGGLAGGRVGRRLKPSVLRAVIVVVGLSAAVQIVF